MSSFSLELQVRASQELVAKHMPKRSIFARAILFAEVASALLFIQVGFLTHPVMIAVPFFIMACVALQRVDYVNGESQHVSFDPRGLFLFLITLQNYSLFGLRRRQQGTKVFVWSMMSLRLICAIVLAPVLLDSCHHACPSLAHYCEWKARDFQLVHEMNAKFRFYTNMTVDHHTCWFHATYVGYQEAARAWHSRMCQKTRPWELQDFEQRERVYGTDFHKVTWPVFPASFDEEGFWSLCDKEAGIIPGILKYGCEREAFDPVYYQTCVDNSWLPGTCLGKLLICSLISEKMTLVQTLALLYVFAPLGGLFLVLPLWLGGCLFGMMSVPENKGLKRAITARARQLEQELRSGKSQSSLWWDRRAFEFKMAFVAIDVILDAGTCLNFIVGSSYILAACQLVTWFYWILRLLCDYCEVNHHLGSLSFCFGPWNKLSETIK